MRRLLLVVVVAGLWTGAGAALFASSAMAGGIDESTGVYAAAIYNFTPYTWTRVAYLTPEAGICGATCWNQDPAKTIAPGTAMVYKISANMSKGDGRTLQEYGYDAWMTYRVDVLGGPAEYVTVALSQAQCYGFYGNCNPALRQFITSSPPPANYDPGPNPDVAPAPLTSGPQLTFAVFSPYDWDLTYAPTGDWTIDASASQGAAFDTLLNDFCGAKADACSFTQTQPITYGIGDPGSPYAATNCKASAGARGSPGKAVSDAENFFEVDYEASQSASLTVGGGVTASTEVSLFGVIGNEVSVSLEAEHEWEEIKSITRKTKIYIPANNIGFVWVVPVVGKVTGTLELKSGSAKFTVTNFSETRSGVGEQTKDALTPAYDVITKVRPMTAAELKNHCGFSTTSPSLGATKGKPPVKLAPGRGVARVKLGQTQAQVLHALGQPSAKRFLVHPCAGLEPRCYATAGTGGRWGYRDLSVVFGPDLRVSGLIYRGLQRTTKGVGVGSGLAAVRRAYPGVSCERVARGADCTLSGHGTGHAINTMFRFIKRKGGRYKCNRVAIYVVGDGAGKVNA
jgi:hypothetical protein